MAKCTLKNYEQSMYKISSPIIKTRLVLVSQRRQPTKPRKTDVMQITNINHDHQSQKRRFTR
jgi:hypothetical protein